MTLPGGAKLDFSRPLVMSIVNCTPDSFYEPSRAYWNDYGPVFQPQAAAEKALQAEAEGADIVDFGAESTRPGFQEVSETEEIRRLLPALKRFRQKSALPVSVDTRKAAVARLAMDEGADIINDVSALTADPLMVGLCAERKAAVVLMHSTAGTIEEIRRYLLEAAEKAQAQGISKDHIIVDPGIGFGKTTKDALLLLNRLATIGGGDYPLLVGVSRKRFIGELTDREAEGRLAGTIAANAIALLNGANIIRVHDTSAAVDLVKCIHAFRLELQE
jgi:dihydropteroate synthase